MSRSNRSTLWAKFGLAVLLILFHSAWLIVNSQSHEFDLLIRGGRILDGSGNPWFAADVAIAGERVVAIGNLPEARAETVLDASGLYVSPGFIDVHSHAASGLMSAELSSALPLLAQGLTTVVINPDGGGPLDLPEQRRQLLVHGLGVNVAQMVPHGSIRGSVVGRANRAATPAELEQMRALVRQGMREGAFGLSSGLFYAPGNFAPTEELIALAREVKPYGGVYSSHIRDEADYGIGVVAAVDEVIRIAREAQIPGVVTHVKALGPRVWGASAQIVNRIERAREEGVEVWADQYPYTASATGLTAALIPRWAEEGGREALLKRLADPTEELLAAIQDNLERRGGAQRIAFRAGSTDLAGKTLRDVAQEQGKDPVQQAIELIRLSPIGIISHNMDEGDLLRLMQRPWVMTASDGGLSPAGGLHPRSYGSFPRRIHQYVQVQKATELEFAVRSMTSLPAMVFDIKNRGVLRLGAFADILVFDLETFRDRASYLQPDLLAEGARFVVVNGRLALDAGEATESRAGRVLRLSDE